MRWLIVLLAHWLLIPVSAESSTLRDKTNWFIMSLGPGAVGSAYIAERCANIVNCGNYAADTARCFSQVGTLLDSAQFSTARKYMTDDLASLADDRDALRALRNIKKLAGEKGRKFNLWTQTLRDFRGDKKKAMKFLGSFFIAREFTSDKLSPEVNQLKSEAYANLIEGMNRGDVKGYPPGVDTNKTGIYHFYSVGRIAAIMREKGVPPAAAAALPFVINQKYEQALNRASDPKAVEDIYTGYAGVQFALSNDQERFSGAGYSRFQTEYHEKGLPAVGKMLKEGLGGNETFCTGIEQMEPSINPNVDRNSILEPLPVRPNDASEDGVK